MKNGRANELTNDQNERSQDTSRQKEALEPVLSISPNRRSGDSHFDEGKGRVDLRQDQRSACPSWLRVRGCDQLNTSQTLSLSASDRPRRHLQDPHKKTRG